MAFIVNVIRVIWTIIPYKRLWSSSGVSVSKYLQSSGSLLFAIDVELRLIKAGNMYNIEMINSIKHQLT